MSKKNTDQTGNDSYVDKILDTVDEYTEKTHERHESHEHKEHGNAPDEGKGDVPTEDRIVRDHATGEETVIRNDNKDWKKK